MFVLIPIQMMNVCHKNHRNQLRRLDMDPAFLTTLKAN